MQEIPTTDGKQQISDDAHTALDDRTQPQTEYAAQTLSSDEPAPAAEVVPLPAFPESRIAEKAVPKRRLKVPAWALASGMLILGLVVGGLVERQRAHSQTIIVSVNGDNITRDSLFGEMQNIVGAQTMRKMIQNKLQMQYAQKLGLAPTDPQVDAEYAKISQRPNFLLAMTQSGLSPGDIKGNLRLQMAETAVISQGVTVTDADAEKYYQMQADPANPKSQFYRPGAVSLRAIATPTLPLAQRALAELAAQTPFELAATTYSVDTSKSNGGLLAPLSFGRSPLHADPALEKRIFGMKVGDQIGPVFFAKQWWIFRCQDKAPSATIPYAQVQDQCLTGAKLLKGNAINADKIKQGFADFQHSSNIQAFWPQYQKVIAH